MTEGFGKAVREALREAGCSFVRHGKGDHDVWRTPDGKPFTVPVKIMSRHTANAILKAIGQRKKF
jgi:predicted RNA binding protein YcfA (HicA-like mRNA interferase family)